MSEIKLEARDYLNHLNSNKQIIRLARYDGSSCIGRGHALILSDVDQVAVMLEDCGYSEDTKIFAGNLVNYLLHPEAEPKLVGTPATIRN
mgnify:CR=1 FL=1